MARQKDTYLVAQYLKTPRDKSRTSQKGYMENEENISYSEKVTVTVGLKDKDLTAAIILNLTQKTVQKCRFDGGNDWETLAKHYATGYPEYLKLLAPADPVVTVADE
jgi:hypothetical protein